MEASQRSQPRKIQLDVTEEEMEGETERALVVCNDLQDIRGMVRILLSLCGNTRKIASVDLASALRMMDEKLEGTEDLSKGLYALLKGAVPAPASPQKVSVGGGTELCLVPAAPPL